MRERGDQHYAGEDGTGERQAECHREGEEGRAEQGAVGQLAGHPAGLAGEIGQLVGTEDEHRDERDDRQLRKPDTEHG